MKTELVRIGNSRGIRIPKPLIEQCGLGNNVELRVENDSLVISPERRPRQGWEAAFRAAGSGINDDRLLETVAPNDGERKEWKWWTDRRSGVRSGSESLIRRTALTARRQV